MSYLTFEERKILLKAQMLEEKRLKDKAFFEKCKIQYLKELATEHNKIKNRRK